MKIVLNVALFLIIFNFEGANIVKGVRKTKLEFVFRGSVIFPEPHHLRLSLVGGINNKPYLCCMYEYYDNELGRILVKPNARAKNIIARRRKADELRLTVPYGFDLKELPRVLDEMRPRLVKVAVSEGLSITDDFVINTFTFQGRIARTGILKDAQMTLKNGELIIFIPEGWDMNDRQLQHRLKEMIRSVLRHEARRVLPQKVAFWAKKYGLQFNQVKINKSISRWGSCSFQKNINLSYYLMLLPEKMIDYVVLHELAHTVEMNHGEKFWELLSNLCGEDARALSHSVQRYNTPVYNLLRP